MATCCRIHRKIRGGSKVSAAAKRKFRRKNTEENALIRILEGGKKIAGKDESFYDNDILRNITEEWQKATRVLTNTLHRMKIKTGDVFIIWRMKQLISIGKVEAMGEVNKSWKDFDVRLPGVKQEEAAGSEEATA